jgi:hypothetical protein
MGADQLVAKRHFALTSVLQRSDSTSITSGLELAGDPDRQAFVGKLAE